MVTVVAQEFTELLQLTVGQRVHRVDDDGPLARRGVGCLGLEDGVDDRDEVSKRLARAGTRGQDIALAALGEPDSCLKRVSETPMFEADLPARKILPHSGCSAPAVTSAST